jgi:hypothetical protein
MGVACWRVFAFGARHFECRMDGLRSEFRFGEYIGRGERSM